MFALCAALVLATTQLGTATTAPPGAPVLMPAPAVIAPVEPGATAQVARGVINGRVTDRDNAVVPGAAVDLVRADATSTVLAHAVTNTTGRFTFEGLPPARYRVSVRLTGFKTAFVSTPVTEDRPVDLDVRLEVGALTESVTVRHLSDGSPVQAPPPTLQTVAPESPIQLLDAARAAYAQRRYADAEQLTARALALMRSGAMTPNGPTPAPSLITRESTPQAPVRVGGEIQAPKKLRDVPPIYPEIAAAAGVQGIVYLEAVVGTDGNVHAARVLRGPALLTDAALDAVRQWRYTPTLLNGKPIEIIMTVTVNFKLGQ